MNNKTEKVKLDRKTEEWLEKHPEVNATVALCQDCGLYYKPSLGHSCKRQNKKIQNGVMEVDTDRNKLNEIISNVIYKENQKALDSGHDVLCTATEYLADKITEAICNNENRTKEHF
jgi:hypothetical protein